jgi:exopolyphosphatase / guanosine-5'-triphosphate,3'-diphosphate pyrophosphatase
MKLCAAIDLGTNTFQLGIYEVEAGRLKIVEEYEDFVLLIREDAHRISPEAQQRATEALTKYRQHLASLGIADVQAVATEGLRKCSNAPEVLASLQSALGSAIRLIGGDEEVEITLRGVQAALAPVTGSFLLCDIGGGSTEFAVVKDESLLYRESFPIGAMALWHRFRPGDPMSVATTDAIMAYLDELLAPAKSLCMAEGITQLAGSSGSFETLAEVMYPPLPFPEICAANAWATLEPSSLRDKLRLLIYSSLDERLALPGLKPQRAPYVPMGSVIVWWLMENITPGPVLVSRWALREGLVLKGLRFEV